MYDVVFLPATHQPLPPPSYLQPDLANGLLTSACTLHHPHSNAAWLVIEPPTTVLPWYQPMACMHPHPEPASVTTLDHHPNSYPPACTLPAVQQKTRPWLLCYASRVFPPLMVQGRCGPLTISSQSPPCSRVLRNSTTTVRADDG